MTNQEICAILYIMNELIEKPDVENWPDTINLQVNGVPIRIEYKTQAILLPKQAEYRQEQIAAYLIDEGFIKMSEENYG